MLKSRFSLCEQLANSKATRYIITLYILFIWAHIPLIAICRNTCRCIMGERYAKIGILTLKIQNWRPQFWHIPSAAQNKYCRQVCSYIKMSIFVTVKSAPKGLPAPYGSATGCRPRLRQISVNQNREKLWERFLSLQCVLSYCYYRQM